MRLGVAGYAGTYPMFIKTRAVLAARPAPTAFQLYKSSTVFVAGAAFVAARLARGAAPGYSFTRWGVVSAFCWVPSGLCTIISVPRIGMSLQNALSSGTTAVLSFLAFWLVFGEQMKVHSCGRGCTFYLAPLYLTICVVGMCGMVFSRDIAARLFPGAAGGSNSGGGTGGGGAPSGGRGDGTGLSEGTQLLDAAQGGSHAQGAPPGDGGRGTGAWLTGVLVAILGGVFASMQYAVVTLGRKWNEDAAGCYGKDTPDCPPRVAERFDDEGSWNFSFGCGAMVAALSLYLLTPLASAVAGSGGGSGSAAGVKRQASDEGDPEANTSGAQGGDGGDGDARLECCGGASIWPSLHWKVLRTAGVAAGTFWVGGNFLNTIAVSEGGQSTTMALYVSTQLVASGLWGILWYGEGGSFHAKGVWSMSAVFTLIAVVLLGLEKQ